jgi:hypothetical protein
MANRMRVRAVAKRRTGNGRASHSQRGKSHSYKRRLVAREKIKNRLKRDT